MTSKPILIIEDDQEEVELIGEVLAGLKFGHPVVFLENQSGLQQYMQAGSKAPAFILCKQRLLCEDGFDILRFLRKEKHPCYATIPFVMWTTHASPSDMQHAADLFAQGFFLQPASYPELHTMLKNMVGYWTANCRPQT